MNWSFLKVKAQILCKPPIGNEQLMICRVRIFANQADKDLQIGYTTSQGYFEVNILELFKGASSIKIKMFSCHWRDGKTWKISFMKRIRNVFFCVRTLSVLHGKATYIFSQWRKTFNLEKKQSRYDELRKELLSLVKGDTDIATDEMENMLGFSVLSQRGGKKKFFTFTFFSKGKSEVWLMITDWMVRHTLRFTWRKIK